jgi:hypothetical protein
VVDHLAQIYGYLLYQHRITLIRRRDPGHFGESLPTCCVEAVRLDEYPDQIVGPVIISIILFGAVLANFIIRGPFTLPRSLCSTDMLLSQSRSCASVLLPYD